MEDEATALLRSIILRSPLELADARKARRSRLERKVQLGW